jgi:uridine kinase
MERSVVLNELATRISQIELTHPVRVAIDGVDASGKTTLADELIPYIQSRNRPVIRASIDGFHNPASVRHARSTLSPEGYYRDSFNYEALVEQLLMPLGPNGTLQYVSAVFDYRADSRVGPQQKPADQNAVLLFDGVFLLRPELIGYWDFSIFVEASLEVTLARALTRDRELFDSDDAVRLRYQRRYIPGRTLYLEECLPKEKASVVIDNNDPSNPSIR